MKVRSTQLLFVLAALWLMAGVSILSVGIAELLERHDWWIVVGALAIFAVFSTVIFPRVIRRYSTRVADMDGGPHHLWEALDMKGYLFMVVMMGLGIALRMSGLAPDWFIASFYPGLGSALILGALGFTHNSFALIYRAANPGVRHHHFQHGSARRG